MHRLGIFVALCAASACAQSSLAYLDLGSSVRPCCITQDAEGNFYVAAAIRRPGPPASLTTVVAKVDRNLKQVYQFTVAQPGGSYPTAIVVDRQGSVFVAGWSDAAGFPLVNPISSDWRGPLSGFISKLDASGTTLLFSTYLGRSVTALALDATGSLYATGYAPPNDIPATPNGYRWPAPPGVVVGTAVFIVKLTNTGDRLIYSAILGVASPASIAVSPDGSVTVVGSTSDAGYPVTPAAFQRICGCAALRRVVNGIVSRISADGSTLVWSTFLGGTLGAPDELLFVASVPNGDVIVAGTATSADFPSTPGALQAGHGLGNSDFVVARLDSSGSRLIYSSRFGSSQLERITALQVDAQGRAWIAGSTSRLDFPVIAGSPSVGNSVVAELEADGSKLVLTQLLPDRVAIGLSLNAAGEPILFGEAGSLLRFGPEGLAGPSVLGISNAVPQQAGYSVSGAVAPGEIVSLYGVALGPSAGVGAQLDSAGKLTSTLAGTQVVFDGVPAPLLYAGATQINAVVPFAVGDRATTTVEVRTSAVRSSSTVLKVVAADPALPAVFDPYFGVYISLVLNQDGSLNSLANRASPGEVVTFWVNGAGRFQQSLADGAIIGPEREPPVLPVKVFLVQSQSLPAEVLYAGTAPGMVAGMMQVNFRIPLNAGPGFPSAIELHVGDFAVYGAVEVE